MSTRGTGRLDGAVFNGKGLPTYKIQGETFHQIGPLLPEAPHAPLYSQLCIYDPREALQHHNDYTVKRVLRPWLFRRPSCSLVIRMSKHTSKRRKWPARRAMTQTSVWYGFVNGTLSKTFGSSL
ncbi:hypothetical protein EDB86DRAFT_1436321 [Lactarius hatsudake]|nr:hypothetical protein EDB86DRAFT_1436321 [Lactarius hatsudake]